MIFKNLSTAHKETGMQRLGTVSLTTKHKKSIKFGELTYSLYLAPAKMSGYEVCPGRTKECTALCLNNSGMNRMSMKEDFINQSRIKKTKLFFEHREYFMDWLIYEIKLGIKMANQKNMKFSVRLNNTSDINPRDFYIVENGAKKNILEIFPDINFYDYTKIPSRLILPEKYKNYHLTLSYTGYNLVACMDALKRGINVAMVFKIVPSQYMGFDVIDGDIMDMRYHDKKGVIVGLKFKKVRTKLTKNVKFVIQ